MNTKQYTDTWSWRNHSYNLIRHKVRNGCDSEKNVGSFSCVAEIYHCGFYMYSEDNGKDEGCGSAQDARCIEPLDAGILGGGQCPPVDVLQVICWWGKIVHT